MKPEQAASDDFVQSLSRGLAIIRTFDADHSALTLSEVAKRAEISPAAARRFLRTLEALGYVRSDNRVFCLTPRVLELGFSYLSALSLPDVMQPHLERLSTMLDESVSAAVLDGADIVYVARVVTRRIMTVGITIGTRFPAYATSMGRVLLASLESATRDELLTNSPLTAFTEHTITDARELNTEIDRVLNQGWALVDSELELGLRSIAAPVQDRTGRVVAAINVSMSSRSNTLAEVQERHIPLLVETARAIDLDLGSAAVARI